jgi:hypothetical protein
MNLARNLENAALYFPDRPALREGGLEISYARLNDRANRVATALIGPGKWRKCSIYVRRWKNARWLEFRIRNGERRSRPSSSPNPVKLSIRRP